MGKLTFLFPSKVEWNQQVFIYIVNDWIGHPKESDEIRPYWFKPADIPYPSMWQDAPHWLPKILTGERIHAEIIFKDDNETVDNAVLTPFSWIKSSMDQANRLSRL